MKRRTFLQYIGLGTAAAPITLKAHDGAVKESKLVKKSANRPVSIQEITREALRILHEKGLMLSSSSKQWPTNKKGTIRIRKPPVKYTIKSKA